MVHSPARRKPQSGGLMLALSHFANSRTEPCTPLFFGRGGDFVLSLQSRGVSGVEVEGRERCKHPPRSFPARNLVVPGEGSEGQGAPHLLGLQGLTYLKTLKFQGCKTEHLRSFLGFLSMYFRMAVPSSHQIGNIKKN